MPYEYATWKRCRVNLDYHVEIDKHFTPDSLSFFPYLAAPATNLDALRARIRSCRAAHCRDAVEAKRRHQKCRE